LASNLDHDHAGRPRHYSDMGLAGRLTTVNPACANVRLDLYRDYPVRKGAAELDAGLEGTTAPLEEIRRAVMFFLSPDEYGACHEHSGGNSDQGPHSDNPLRTWTQPSRTVLLRKGHARHCFARAQVAKRKRRCHQPRKGVTCYQGRQYQRRVKARGRAARG
jgi:hypothetical protein